MECPDGSSNKTGQKSANHTGGDLHELTGGDRAEGDLLNEASVMILGAPDTGKSAIVSRLVRNQFIVEYNPSTSEEFNILDVGNEKDRFRIHFHNPNSSTGKVPWSSVVKRDIINADAFLLVYAVNNRESFDRALEYRERIGALRNSKDFVLLVGNKMDVPMKERVITPAEAELRALHWDTDVLEISAKVPHGIGELKRNIYRMVDVPVRLYSLRRRSSLQQLLSKCLSR